MTRKSGVEYCLEHLNLLKKDVDDERKRISCPLDSRHSVWEDQLKKHLTKCNKFKLSHINDNELFYSKDLNRGRDIGGESIGDYKQYLQKVIHLLKVLQEEKKSVFGADIPLRQESNDQMVNSRLNEVNNKKHALQQSSLIQNLINYKILDFDSKNQDFIEFGCGRAEFSRYLNQIIYKNLSTPREIKYHLIDRSSSRMKFDTKFVTDTQEITKQKKIVPSIDRIKIDIKDLLIDKKLSPESNYVALSKHLCGVATDLTLRCIANNSLLRDHLDGLCIAMCCRHVCNANDYINPDYIKSLIPENEDITYTQFFGCLSMICSWATNGRRPETKDSDIVKIHNSIEMTVIERESLGLIARQIIDIGRLKWVQANLSKDTHLIHYVDKSISLENVTLIMKSTEF